MGSSCSGPGTQKAPSNQRELVEGGNLSGSVGSGGSLDAPKEENGGLLAG